MLSLDYYGEWVGKKLFGFSKNANVITSGSVATRKLEICPLKRGIKICFVNTGSGWIESNKN
jgi:hypothetical protein